MRCKLEHETGLEPAEALAVASSATAPPHVGKEMLGLNSYASFRISLGVRISAPP